MKNLAVLSTIVLTAFCMSCQKNNLPKVQTISYEFVTMDSVLLIGEVTNDADATVTQRGFCWAKHTTPTVSDNNSENGMGSGVFFAKIGSLEIGQEYYFRSYAVNAGGLSYGETLTFKFEFPVVSGTFTDSRDNKIYKTVVIGKQTWMAENLGYLPSLWGSDPESSEFYTVPMFNYRDGSIADAKANPNYLTYGVLYNYKAAMTACPQGWHLPSKEEFDVLIRYVGPLGHKKMKSITNWTPYGNGDNTIGWNAFPAGDYTSESGFGGLGSSTGYWSSTFHNTEWFLLALFMPLSLYDQPPYIIENRVYIGYSVRCIKDN